MSIDSEDHTVVIHVVPGQVLDERWRIDSRIGQGAMGSVFRGRDLVDQRVVAIKILSPEHCRKPKVLARFDREAEAMTQLRHPNIVQLFGHGRHGLLPYIAMEFLEGFTLADVLQKHGGTLGLGEAVAVIKQVAAGLSFLHHHGLVHRDVKPQNIVISAAGRVTILDLGVVRDQHNPGLTRPGAMVGTPYYMSPEQIYGSDDIDRRTDVYALAAMTFELLTGRPPFLGNNNFEVLYGHKNLPPPDASQLVKSVPKPVAQVLVRALAKRRQDRPETVSELVADLEAIIGVQRVDLQRALALAMAPRRVAHERTVIHRQRLKPQEEDLPMADPDDVDSVAGPAPDEHGAADEPSPSSTSEDPTMQRPEATLVGEAQLGQDQQLEETTGLMPLLNLSPGALQVVATVQGRPVQAIVELDGTVRGVTPYEVSLSPGAHELTVSLDGFSAVSQRVDIAAGQPTSLALALEPSPAKGASQQ